jgi:fatty acid-binding protein DegV
MADKVSDAIGKGKAKVAYVHAGAKQEVEKLKRMVEGKVDVVESFVAELSPALTVHTGPGTAGVCYVSAP